MRINSDFSERVIVRPGDIEWVASPMAGVDRQMLDRIGDEVARATSIVRYAPQSYFPEHEHGGGEEFFVLSGIFSDETGDFPAGSYVRNPIGTRHTPHSDPGCTIFVKLQQFDAADTEQFSTDTRSAKFDRSGNSGLSILPLHEFGSESVSLIRFYAGSGPFDFSHAGGSEILVLEGTLNDEQGAYPDGSWIRTPHLCPNRLFSKMGCLIYLKTGHLPID